MCKKKKQQVTPVVAEPAKEVSLENFELIKQEAVYDDKGNRDYFTEYYNAYKNDYIEQYLAAYKMMKEGKSAEKPVQQEAKSEPVEQQKDEVDE